MSAMSQRIVTVDAFTDRPFAGNPAAVCVLPAPADAEWMQNVAMEMNLSETAFVQRLDDGWSLRWFTPAVEVDLCGHATLASAHVLWQDGHVAPTEEARFRTRSGLLTARRADGWIEMDFPSQPVTEPVDPSELRAALGVDIVFAGSSTADWLVEVGSEREVRRLRPDLRMLARLPARGIIVTAPASAPGVDFVSRFFAPRVGVDEDPVTGSAHVVLAPYWSEKLRKDEMVGFQASRRGGTVRVQMRGDRVGIGGQAVTVMEGTLA
jgi:PhzF family phenazine biosynthesis protein